MLSGKPAEFFVPGRDLGADRVVDDEPVRMGAEPVTDGGESVRTLGCLGKNLQRLGKIDPAFADHGFEHFVILDDECVSADLPEEAEHFCMADLSENQKLPVPSVFMQPEIGFPDTFLQFQNDRAGTVDQPQPFPVCLPVSLRRLAMGPDQEGRTGFKAFQIVTPDRDKALPPQPVEFGLIVDDRTERVKAVLPFGGQVFLRFPDSADHAAAEPGMTVYFNGEIHPSVRQGGGFENREPALEEPEDPDELFALSLITAGLDPRVTACVANHPALSDMAGYAEKGRTGGYPHFNRENQMLTPQKIETLQYYDVVNFASRIKCPVYLTWGYNDNTCPPTTSYIVWNLITAPKQSLITPVNEHWTSEATNYGQMLWLKEHISE